MMKDTKSLTGMYLANKKKIEVSNESKVMDPEKIRLMGASEHNLKQVDVELPLNRMVCNRSLWFG